MLNIKKTKENLENFLMNIEVIENHLNEFDRIIIKEDNDECTCFFVYDFNTRCKCFYITLYPCITCMDTEREELRKFVEEVNNMFSSGTVLIDSNGSIYFQTSQKYIDSPISTEVIALMHLELQSILAYTLNNMKKIIYKAHELYC